MLDKVIIIGLFVALGRITSRGVRAIVSYSDGHLLGKMVAFGRFQVKCFQRNVFLYVGSVCLREVMSRSYTSQDIMSGFMSVNLKKESFFI